MKAISSIYRFAAVLTTALFAAGIFCNTRAEDMKGGCKFGCIPEKIEVADIIGTNFCPACELNQSLGAASACKTYGHKHAFKVTSFVDACGNKKDEFIGKTLFFLENDKSTELISGHHGETLEIRGKVYLEIPMIEVESFKIVE